jgi:hypothetical protein
MRRAHHGELPRWQKAPIPTRARTHLAARKPPLFHTGCRKYRGQYLHGFKGGQHPRLCGVWAGLTITFVK